MSNDIEKIVKGALEEVLNDEGEVIYRVRNVVFSGGVYEKRNEVGFKEYIREAQADL